jgi:hypothetical protein
LAIPPRALGKGEKFGTKEIYLEGGLILNMDSLVQAENAPGSATALLNMEPDVDGGYSRIRGYTKADNTQVPGSGVIKGTFVFNDVILAMRSANVYASIGTGWVGINTDTRTDSIKYRCARYNFSEPVITCVDGGATTYPFRYSAAGVYTVLTNAPQGQRYIEEFKRHLCLAAGSLLTISAPGNDNDYTTGNGAIQINVGFTIVGIKKWRDELYIFGVKNISKLTGSSSADYQVLPVANQIGCISEDSIQEVGGDLLYRSADGIRTIAGTNRIGDVELASLSRAINSIIGDVSPMNMASVAINSKSQYRLFQSVSSTIKANAPGFIGYIRQRVDGTTAWEWAQTQGFKVACIDSNYLSDGSELVVFGEHDGYVYIMDSGDDFDGSPIYATWTTPALVFDDPEVRKTFYKMCAFIRCDGNASINVGTLLDFNALNLVQPNDRELDLDGTGIAFYDSSPYSYYDAANTMYDKPLNNRICTNLVGSGFSASFTFTTNGGPRYNIRSITVQYNLAARR